MSNKILLIEDEPELASFICRGLREEGYTIDAIHDGTSGWHALQRGQFDVVILDWNLPGVDGMALLKRFREADKTTPVLFLTARDAVPDRVAGLDIGADDYLTKPFAFDELLARLRALLRRPKQVEDRSLTKFGITIDLDTHRAERDGHKLDLTVKEQSLLLYFMRNVDRVLSKTRIYEQVWDDRYDGISNTLEVHIKELRRKLEAHGPRVIQTLRGRGYLFGMAAESDGE